METRIEYRIDPNIFTDFTASNFLTLNCVKTKLWNHFLRDRRLRSSSSSKKKNYVYTYNDLERRCQSETSFLSSTSWKQRCSYLGYPIIPCFQRFLKPKVKFTQNAWKGNPHAEPESSHFLSLHKVSEMTFTVWFSKKQLYEEYEAQKNHSLYVNILNMMKYNPSAK